MNVHEGTSRPKPPVDLFDPYCWACGAQDGDCADGSGAYLAVALCAPHDRRFATSYGVQWFCTDCVTGWAQHVRRGQPEWSGRRWFFGVRTKEWVLVAHQL